MTNSGPGGPWRSPRGTVTGPEGPAAFTKDHRWASDRGKRPGESASGRRFLSPRAFRCHCLADGPRGRPWTLRSLVVEGWRRKNRPRQPISHGGSSRSSLSTSITTSLNGSSSGIASTLARARVVSGRRGGEALGPSRSASARRRLSHPWRGGYLMPSAVAVARVQPPLPDSERAASISAWASTRRAGGRRGG